MLYGTNTLTGVISQTPCTRDLGTTRNRICRRGKSKYWNTTCDPKPHDVCKL